MKPRSALLFRAAVLAALANQLATAAAVVFTNDTLIPTSDTNFDGSEVTVSNCTLTVDGPHTFSNLLVTAGGTVTHSFWPTGSLSNLLSVADEPQTLAGTNIVTLLNSNILTSTVRVTDDGAAVTYTNGLDYLLSDLGGGLIGLQRTTNSYIPDGTNVLVSYDAVLTVWAAGLNLTVAGDMEVAAGGVINTSGKGYGGNFGAGNGGEAGSPISGGGGGHGGYGGLSSSNAAGGVSYGLLEQPTTLGSGGGASSTGTGGAGGGTIRLVVNGNMTVNGVVSADGAHAVNSRSGGGAGGSIWITTQQLAGGGTISANGGNGEPIHGGGGGGGRIALEFTTNLLAGTIHAQGGTGFQRGGAGTVFTKAASETNGVLTLDNGSLSGAITPFCSTSTPVLIVQCGAVACPGGTVASLSVSSNGWLSIAPGSMTFNLTVTGDAMFAAGGGIDAVGKGYANRQGPGFGQFGGGGGGGAGHAGYGGLGATWVPPAGGAIPGENASGGNYYDSLTQPSEPGSGGGGNSTYPGGAGGAYVRLSVSNLLQLDGSILADGGRPLLAPAGGGSGGSIRLAVGTLSGAGRISANGGSAFPPNGGGGSGGRIAVRFDTNHFSGTITATGGTGFENGAAGTMYTRTNSASVAQVVVDNGDFTAQKTFLTSAGTVDLTIQGGALAAGASDFHDLTICSNSALLPTGQNATLTASGNVRIEQGGVLSIDGGGDNSTGLGYHGVGGGHGGYGGTGSDHYNGWGGNAHDYLSNPSEPGSSGGWNLRSGGGCLRFTVAGWLWLDGRISVDGLPGTGDFVGGGSGGSLWLTLGSLAGTGILSANGGAGGLPNGGGGGGGRIAVYCASNSFTGSINAKGGPGYVAGGAGTIYLKVDADGVPQVTLDNGGLRGTSTAIGASSLDVTALTDLTVRGGAVTSKTNDYYLRNLRDLFIGSNSWLYTPYYICANCGSSLTVSGNAIIEAGGGISVDGMGYRGGQADGRYSDSTSDSGGGGGHGGRGGNGAFGSSRGGAAFDSSITRPTSPGGSGGQYGVYYDSSENTGGGAFRLTVNGLLKLDGVISANGLPGLTRGSGGGAGGSLWLTVGKLAGSGVIAADGGNGHLPSGGGGGGGRIAIYWTSNSFTGTLSAKGGAGYMTGGAGTIYTKPSDLGVGQVLADNGGQRGTNTPIYAFSPNGDLIVRNGAVVSFPGASTIRHLSVESNATVAAFGTWTTLAFEHATVATGGGITADGSGSGPASGTGAGSSSLNPKGGGSHGGLGGANPLAVAFGSVQSPTGQGSGGGNGSGSSAAPYGGSGGGALRLNVVGELVLDGRISADGTGGGLNSGGGAGGSLWLIVGTLAGSGSISANGGAGNGTAGGGGGGRVAIQFTTNLFTGPVTAFGGAGSVAGGAGTLYWEQSGSTSKRLVVNNGGLPGTNTPLYGLAAGLDLSVANGGIAHPQTSFPLFGSVDIGTGGLITSPANRSNLILATRGDLTIELGGSLSVDGKGNVRTNGPGAGVLLSGQGGGGGYGGTGGASSSGAPGGTNYGSAAQPVDFGSGGGASAPGSSEGGGAVRLSVGGTLSVAGLLSANGQPGWQDDSGGGAGGSLWVSAGALTGDGLIAARGGAGELFNGGGGGGGRIAIYSPLNTFTGAVSVAGGAGANAGQDGTVFTSAALPDFQITSHSPSGVVSNTASYMDLNFSEVVNPDAVSAADFVLFTPAGPLPQSNLTVSVMGLSTVRVGFPPQNLLGDYRLEAGPGIENVLAQALSQVYTGNFTVVLPTLSGTVTDTNGLPVPGVVLQPGGGWLAATTDANGSYSLGVPPGWNGSVAPALGSFMFAPGSRSYMNVSESVSNQNYRMVETFAPQVNSGVSGTNLWLNWDGLAGVNYQAWWSTNLANWHPWAGPLPGTNGLMELLVPIEGKRAQFFRLTAGN